MNYNILADTDFYNHQFFSDYERYSNKFFMYKILKHINPKYLNENPTTKHNFKYIISTNKEFKISIKSENIKFIKLEYNNEEDLFKNLNKSLQEMPEFNIPVINFSPQSNKALNSYLILCKLNKKASKFPINLDLLSEELDIFYKININHSKLVDYLSEISYTINMEEKYIEFDNSIKVFYDNSISDFCKFIKLNVYNQESTHILYRQNIKMEKSKLYLDDYIRKLIKNEKN